ncbi:right-handed parallel beta-helix repeat-containing protein [Bacteroidales bacterium OttesenSCG-928-C19]|nr:right-handed parallel beta-helix repeat-containing protein [Bacteroidales bacterium OttesenSCG-928-C19]
MKRNLLTFATTILMGLSSLIAQTIIVQDAEGKNARLYTDLETAVNGANSGDYLYLSGGTYDITSTWKGYDGKGSYANYLVIEKLLHFVGAGYQQGLDIPVLKGTIAFRKSASGSTVTGLLMDNIYLDSISNTRISRCKITNNLHLCGTGSNDVITECDINTVIGAESITSNATIANYLCIISKNIIKEISHFENVTISNNIISSYFSSLSNVTIKNNIFTHGMFPDYSAKNSEISNNILVGAFSINATNTYTNNFEGYTTSEIFMDYTKGDYHLKETCPGKNAGTDGTDIGIYGTEFPFKDLRVPGIPYFSNKEVAPETGADGKLKVNITVEAQER